MLKILLFTFVLWFSTAAKEKFYEFFTLRTAELPPYVTLLPTRQF